MKESNNTVNPLTPSDQGEMEISEAKKKSVGIPAIKSSLDQMAKYMKGGDALKLSLKMNQKDGFDCPGCAWPDPDDDRSKLGEYCENGIKAIAEEATKKALTPEILSKYTVQELSAKSDFELGKMGRLTHPMIKEVGTDHYQKTTWTEAFDLIGDYLKELSSPDEAIFYTSGRTSNEAAFLYQLLVRSYGTNNLPDCSNMCHESSGVGLSKTLGIGKGSVSLEDLHTSELIMVMGQNPGTNHPRMLAALEKCKKNGGKIITVHPLPEAGLLNYIDPQSPKKMLTGGTKLTDIFVPIRINGDVAFLKGIMYLLYLEDEKEHGSAIDHDFVKDHCSDYDEFLANIKNVDVEYCAEQAGVSLDLLREVAAMILQKKKMIICWAMGLTQHENGVDNIQEVVNLLLMRGAIGKPGAGTCPVRGHSNVQGDRTMGIWEAPKDAFLDKLDEVYGIESPREHGYAVVSAIHAMYEKKAKFFFAMGGNFLSATPDTLYTAKALENCELTVQVSTKLNRSHLVTGKRALILPCLGRTDMDFQNKKEQFVSCENSMGVVQKSKGILNPISDQLLSEVAIVCEIGKLLSAKISWEKFLNYDLIRDDIERVIPGFDDYNERVRLGGGFYLPNGVKQRKFHTATGKARFTVNPIPRNDLKEGDFEMMTIRSHDQYNTTIYGNDDRYRGIKNGRRIIFMNEHDMKEMGVKSKELLKITSVYNGVERSLEDFKVVPFNIPRRNVATYFPETNALVPIDSMAKLSHTPASKRVVVNLKKV